MPHIPLRGHRAAVTCAAAVMLAAAAVPGSAAGAPSPADTDSGDWPTWQKDVSGSRYAAAETAITPATVGRLRLRWAFAFPGSDGSTSSQPAVVGETLYVGGRNSRFYALDARSGAVRWSFDVRTVTGPAPSAATALRDGPAVAGGSVYVGDSHGRLYALDAASGRLRWRVRLSSHAQARLTGSPLVWQDRVYVGVSSGEELAALVPGYRCCTFHGSVVALDARTGAEVWRYDTVPAARRDGSWRDGTPRYAPSGGAVWGSPAVDPASGTLVVGTGDNYTGTAGDTDAVLALDAATGALRWRRQLTHPDEWTFQCLLPLPTRHCSDPPGPDFDFGSTPNIFRVGARTVAGIGQKSGVYHAFDLTTGRTVWQTPLPTVPDPEGSAGIQWGTSYDGHRLYIATNRARPGVLYALDPASGAVLWRTANPADGCRSGGAALHPAECGLAHIPATSSSPGLVYEGSQDGKVRVYAASTGAVLWEYDTVRPFAGANGVHGIGGSVSGNGGAVVAHGMMYVQSGYGGGFGIGGNVLLAFAP